MRTSPGLYLRHLHAISSVFPIIRDYSRSFPIIPYHFPFRTWLARVEFGAMSYLLRVQLPDTPGSLGYLAAALGEVDGDIRSVDVVEHDVNGTVTDDIVVDLPSGKLPDTLITAAQTLDGVEVDSIRPFSGTVDRRGQIRLLAAMAAHRNEPRLALREIVDGLSQTMSAGWALALETADDGVSRLAASPAAPEDDGRTLSHPPVTETRLLDPETEDWIPPS